MSPARPAEQRWLGTERSRIEDVASAAGVSVATVSRALRGLPNVAVSTRARVEAAARTRGVALADLDTHALNRLWDAAKAATDVEHEPSDAV